MPSLFCSCFRTRCGIIIEDYGAQKGYQYDQEALDDSIASLSGEVENWFEQPPLMEEELGWIDHYMHVVTDRMFEIDHSEKERLK